MKKTFTLSVLTIGHFIVDLSCLYFYFSCFPQNGLIASATSALLYNFLAFAVQAPIGYFFDRFPAKHSTTVGIFSILCGYACGLSRFSLAGLILCGIGNAFYHVGGSIGIACTDKKRLRNSGIFVSAGALGVSLGTYLANQQSDLDPLRNLVTALILLLLIVLLILQSIVITQKNLTSSKLPQETDAALLFLSLIAVFIRSVGGLFFPSSYRTLFIIPGNSALTIFLLAMASGIIAFLGKFLGGFLSNRCTRLLHKYAPTKTIDIRSGNYIFGATTLLASTILFTLGNDIPILCFLGILCFHAAMPVTLFELYCILPEHPGFAMGLSTLMLFLGYLPYTFMPRNKLPASLILCCLTLLAAGCMLVSLKLYNNAGYTKEEQT